MVYKIRDSDGEVYTFATAKEVLIALARALSGHEYYDEQLGWIEPN